jgi:hypothetical protein
MEASDKYQCSYCSVHDRLLGIAKPQVVQFRTNKEPLKMRLTLARELEQSTGEESHRAASTWQRAI